MIENNSFLTRYYYENVNTVMFLCVTCCEKVKDSYWSDE